MNAERLSRTFALVFTVLGVFVTLFLTWSHYTGALDQICRAGSGCGKVLTSAYSHFLGFPTASYGFLYYFTFLLLLLLLPYVKDEGRQFFFTLGLALHTVALAFSLFLTAYSILVIQATCRYCLISTGLVVLLFGITLYWKVRDVNLNILEKQSGELWKGTTVVLVLFLLFLGGLFYRAETTPDTSHQIDEIKALQVTTTTLGDPKAPIRVIEFYDLACPYCRKFVKNTFPKIRKKYIETGKVSWSFRAFPDPISHEHALYAHAFLTMVPDSKFLKAKTQIMLEADRWVARRNETPRPFFYSLSKKYEIPKLKQPSGAIRSKILRNRAFYQDELGITGTPSFLVNGKVYRGALTLKDWRRIINKILGDRATNQLTG